MKKIIWLASYPKSGNTWTRAFLSNLLGKPGEADDTDINDMIGGPIASLRDLFDEHLCIETSDFSIEEIDLMRPATYRLMAQEINEAYHFTKVHDAYTYTSSGEAMFPSDITKCAVYIVRNPLDVAVSFAHHNNKDLQKMVSQMLDAEFAYNPYPDDIKAQIRQKIFAWSAHVASWTENPDFPVLLIRYEDLLQDPQKIFTGMLRFCGLEHSEEEIKRAIDKCTFDKLKKAEEQHGFKEKTATSKSFFRKGKAGSWREQMSDEQVAALIDQNRDMMHKLGYLDADNNPVY